MNRLVVCAVVAVCGCSGTGLSGAGGGGTAGAGGGTSGVGGGGGAVGGGSGGSGGTDAGGSGGGGTAGGAGGGAAGGSGGSGGGATSVDAGLAPGEYARTMPGYPARGYDLLVPPGYDGGVGFPLIFGLHGGGGNRDAQRRLSCPGGVLASPSCFDKLAIARGFVVAYPDGTGAALAPNIRTWNSGGGSSGWQCVSGGACNNNVDEKAYFTALMADIASVVPVNLQRVYATGLSNGAGMSERLACEFPNNVSAIASVAGGNQWSTTRPCTSAVSVLEIHGTADPCWEFDGGPAACADPNMGNKIGIPATLALWRANNGCTATPVSTTLPDTAADGTLTVKRAFTCTGKALELYEVQDGGHTWPSGFGYSTTVGLTSQDFSANQVILDFFTAH